jgi:hypothetical protein
MPTLSARSSGLAISASGERAGLKPHDAIVGRAEPTWIFKGIAEQAAQKAKGERKAET